MSFLTKNQAGAPGVEFLCQSAAGRKYRTKIPLTVARPNFIQDFD
jgi:hypothetical protein